MDGLPPLAQLGNDLVGTSRRRRRLILARPFVYLLAYALAAGTRHWILALAALFLLVVAVVSTMHDVVHGVLGLRRRGTDLALFGLGALVLVSGHAYRRTHQHHHRVFPDESDPEGIAAHWGPLRALADGPVHVARIWWWTLSRTRRPRARAWLIAEAAVAVALPVAALLLRHAAPAFTLYVLLVLTGGWLYPLLTVHLPHRHFGATPELQAHTLRGRLLPPLLLEQTYHLEHHLYPRVPSHKLPCLARRLEPALRQRGVVPVRVP
jgi:beta-carotene hydroxylase